MVNSRKRLTARLVGIVGNDRVEKSRVGKNERVAGWVSRKSPAL